MSATYNNNPQYNMQVGTQYDPHHDPSTPSINRMPLHASTAPTSISNDTQGAKTSSVGKQIPPLRSRSHDQSTKGYQSVSQPPAASHPPRKTAYETKPLDLSQHFDRRRQALSLFVTALARLLITLLLIAMFIVSLYMCECRVPQLFIFLQ